MALDDLQQLKKLLTDSRQVLLISDDAGGDDALASALALKIFLEKEGKIVEAAQSGFTPPGHLRFLPGVESVKSELAHLQKFIIKVDLSRAKIENLSYDIKDNWLSIYLNPRQGAIGKDDLRTAQSNFKYDLIITLGARDLNSLGNIYFNNTDLFYRTPTINFDHHPGNERFAQINIVDLTATSTAEVLCRALFALKAESIDANTATCLLTGMISQTRSFKTPGVTPSALNLAGKLIELGAEREKIIQHLYRRQTLPTLKLWGRALSNLEIDRETGISWSAISREDFSRSGANQDDLLGVAEELIANSPEAKIILLLSEDPAEIKSPVVNGFLSVDKQYDATELLRPFHPLGNKKTASFKLADKTLSQAAEASLQQIKSALGRSSLPASLQLRY